MTVLRKMFLLCLLIGVAWTTPVAQPEPRPVAQPGFGDTVDDYVDIVGDGIKQAGDWTEGAINYNL